MTVGKCVLILNGDYGDQARMPGLTPEEVFRILYALPEDVEDSDINADFDDDSESPNTSQILRNSDNVIVSNEDNCFNLTIDTSEIGNMSPCQANMNLYARQERCVVKSGKKTTKVSSNWQDITVPELKAFLGMLILMGVHQFPQLGNYWSTDPILGVTAISSVMTKLRYKRIVENLHCNDNSTCVKKGKPSYDKLQKIRPVTRAISNKLCKVYKPSSVLAVDECMVAFKGRSTLKQYVPMKPVKRGYKVWCLADASTGFIINFDIYTGKRDTNDTSEFTLGEEVVLTLTKAMDGSKRLVAFDNYFTTVRIIEELQSHGLYGIGTVHPNRKDLPDMLKTNSKLSRQEFEFSVRSCVAAVKWQDSKPVCILSNYHNPKHVTTVLRRNKDGSRSELFCPLAVAEYNKIMGGVDRFDQLRERDPRFGIGVAATRDGQGGRTCAVARAAATPQEGRCRLPAAGGTLWRVTRGRRRSVARAASARSGFALSAADPRSGRGPRQAAGSPYRWSKGVRHYRSPQ
ncbi:piggyBac transposable element-derived protein 4-like [Schistocerca americana]|uniref:piggyBac transposable element-derived protein 4-like n=1 Tax=Schistocerca americana TaxID=7009 RepID=UPI001F4FDE93|nr:piggyBac transposable element-derived protein 4-like [Schistocerca americana]